MSHIHEVVIIGSGPAGLTAALYAARADLHPIVILGNEVGGQLMTTTEVENYPGFPDGIQGPDLMSNFMKQAERFGAKLVYGTASAVDFSGPFHTITVGKEKYTTHAVIIATGASAQWLGLPSEQKLRGKGVSACATCDGAFFRGKKVIVVGGGDVALEDAFFLTKFASSVTIVNRSEVLRASRVMQEKVKANNKIAFMMNTQVREIFGENKVTGIKLFNSKTEQITDIGCDGVFVAIGHKPNTGIFQGILDMDQKGYLKKQEYTFSPISGVFIAGDVTDFRYRQAVTAAGEGCKAAIDVERFLANQKEA